MHRSTPTRRIERSRHSRCPSGSAGGTADDALRSRRPHRRLTVGLDTPHDPSAPVAVPISTSERSQFSSGRDGPPSTGLVRQTGCRGDRDALIKSVLSLSSPGENWATCAGRTVGHRLVVGRRSAEPGLVCAERALENRGGRGGAVGGDPSCASSGGSRSVRSIGGRDRTGTQSGGRSRVRRRRSIGVMRRARSSTPSSRKFIDCSARTPSCRGSASRELREPLGFDRRLEDNRRRLPPGCQAALSAASADVPAARGALPVRCLAAPSADRGW